MVVVDVGVGDVRRSRNKMGPVGELAYPLAIKQNIADFVRLIGRGDFSIGPDGFIDKSLSTPVQQNSAVLKDCLLYTSPSPRD